MKEGCERPGREDLYSLIRLVNIEELFLMFGSSHVLHEDTGT